MPSVIPPLAPIAGVPQPLIDALNDRLRVIGNLTAPSSAGALISGTHVQRVSDYPPAKQVLGTQFAEKDRGNVVYEVQNRQGAQYWVYVAGRMTGTISPDQRPKDLSQYDAGFSFFATDSEASYHWTGSAWSNDSANVVMGASALTTLNTIPKVTANGTLGNSAVTDDGTNVKVTGRNVGILTTPSAPLHVKYAAANTTGTTAALIIDNPSGGTQTSLSLRINGTAECVFRADNSGNVALAPGSGGSTYLGWSDLGTPGFIYLRTTSNYVDTSNNLTMAGNVNTGGVFEVNGVQVVRGRQTGPGSAPSTYSQSWCNSLLAVLQNHGLCT